LKRKILTVWKGKFWQFEKGNFDSLKSWILTVWKGKFWQFEKGNFDSFKKENFDSLKRRILTDKYPGQMDPHSNTNTTENTPINYNEKIKEKKKTSLCFINLFCFYISYYSIFIEKYLRNPIMIIFNLYFSNIKKSFFFIWLWRFCDSHQFFEPFKTPFGSKAYIPKVKVCPATARPNKTKKSR
jgi:hypothetical protein